MQYHKSNNPSLGVVAQQVASDFAVYEPPVTTNTIVFSANLGQEMLKITEDGFYVRGVKVKQDKKEAEAVYKAFKRWMVEYELRRPW